MSSKKDSGGKGDPLDDLGSAFDDLYREAEEGLREAEDELSKLSRDSVPTSRASRSRPSVEPVEEGHEAAEDSDYCRELRRRLDRHAATRARVSPDSEIWQDYQRLQDEYVSNCRGSRPRVRPRKPSLDVRERIRTVGGVVGQDVYGGRDLEDHRRQRASATYRPASRQEFNTDAMDLADDASAILERYRALGRQACGSREPAAGYPRSDSPALRGALEQVKAAFREGFREARGESPVLGLPPPPGARRSRTRKPDNSFTGPALEEHRGKRKGDGYDPRTEPEFHSDAKDLKEWELHERTLPPGHSERNRATARKEEILDAYRKLGRRAHEQEEPAANYPRTSDPEHRETVDRLKEAFREGYRAGQGARPSAGPRAPRGRAKPGPPFFTGRQLESHRKRRHGGSYAPRTETEFHSDARDLEEWEGQRDLLPPGHSEHTRSTRKAESILDAYRALGHRATQGGSDAHRPATQDKRFKKQVGALRKAYDEGKKGKGGKKAGGGGWWPF